MPRKEKVKEMKLSMITDGQPILQSEIKIKVSSRLGFKFSERTKFPNHFLNKAHRTVHLSRGKSIAQEIGIKS